MARIVSIALLPIAIIAFNLKNFFALRKIIAYALSFSLVFSQTAVLIPRAAFAYDPINPPQNITDNPIHHIKIDPDRAGNTTLDRAQNGTPVVNINAASQGGVSANYYRDFNVNEENLILNNFQGEAAVSNLGGALHGNPNLNVAGTKAADIILNEVTSSRVTNLNGYTEVFGKQAELIIANPNGIMVGGAGFINTSRLSLVTGSGGGLDANGNLNPFLISENPNALISVVGRDIVDSAGNPVAYNLGIDMSGGNYVDLISRIVQLNGRLLASKEINVKTGNDTAMRGADGWSVNSTDKSGKPEFAIDSTALGGIYAGRVNIIATEDGVGVRTRGDVVASVDDIKFDAKGNIVVDGDITAVRDVEIGTTKRLSNIGNVSANNNVLVKANDVSNDGTIKASNAADIDSNNLANTGLIQTGAGDVILVIGNKFKNSGEITAISGISVKASYIFNADGIIKANNTIDFESDSFTNSGSVQTGNGDIIFVLSNKFANSGEICAIGDISIKANDASNAGTIKSNNDVFFDTGKFANTGEIVSINNVSIIAENEVSNEGSIKANNAIDIKSTGVVNTGLIQTGTGAIALTINGLVNSGEIHSGSGLSITQANIDNRGGKLIADGAMSIAATSLLSNDSSKLLAGSDLTLAFADSADFDIFGGLQAGGTLTISAKNIRNLTDDIRANNIVLNVGGNFENGTGTTAHVLSVLQDLTLNITGDITNYGKITAGGNGSITSGGSIYNGTNIGSSATIHTGSNLIISAATRILNKGFIQAIGILIMKTLAAINDDYYLTANSDIEVGNTDESLAPYYQNLYDNLDTNTDMTSIDDLLVNIKTEEQYYRVWNHKRLLQLQDALDDYSWENPVSESIALSLSESELQENLAEVLGDDYDASDWELEAFESASERAAQIVLVLDDLADEKETYYRNLDWTAMSQDEFNDGIAELLADNYEPGEWSILEYVAPNPAAALNTAYVNSLRINSIDTTKTEKTGVHNYGRIYGGESVGITSNSVAHNNANSLIYSNGDIDFSVKNILFNNENAAGQGIIAGGAINIHGLPTSVAGQYSSLEQLLNYDGRIEADGNINIKAASTINYGSDEYDMSVAGNIAKAYTTTRVHLENPANDRTIKTDWDSPATKVKSDTSFIKSNAGDITVNASNIVNYNSQITARDILLSAVSLLNTTLQFNVVTRDYYTRRTHDCTGWKPFGICFRREWRNHDWTENKTRTLTGLSPAKILASGNLTINATKIGNGTSGIGSIDTNARLPYSPVNPPETPLQEILRTGAIDPLAGFELPTGGYGTIRQTDKPNSGYLYESDPLLIDLSRYLGSQYFMNRINIDPHDVEAKFIGDAFVEHEMLKKSLEQVSSFRNTSMTDEQLEDYINGLYNTLTADMVSDLGLEFGKSLTAAQIAELDEDIVWYVEQEITLPNGEKITALVPQVYLAQSTLNELYSAALAREDTQTSIRGDNVTIEALNAETESILTNLGVIAGNRQLVISTDEINNAAATIGGQQPVLRGGDLLTLNTGENGVVNNLSGKIETTNAGSQLTINTGELNNITQTQQETISNAKTINLLGHEYTDETYKKIETHIGGTATIASAGDMTITTTRDLNMEGSKIASVGDAELNVGGNLTSTAVQDYEYEYSNSTYDSGFLEKTTEISINESLHNITSGIIAGGNMNLNIDKDLISVGTEFLAGGDLNANADNMYLMNATDFENNYYYKKVEAFDLVGAIVNVAASAAIGGGIGALAAAPGALNVKKGSVEIKANYDEEILGTVFAGNNVNLNSDKDTAMMSTTIVADNDLNINTGGQLYLGTAEEKHYSMDHKEKFGGDLVKAAVSGAVTGITSAIGGGIAGEFGGAFVGDVAGAALGYSASKSSSPIMNGIDHMDSVEATTVLQSSSNIIVGNDMSVSTNKDLTISGSNVAVGNDATLTSETGNVNIISATETQSVTEKKVRTDHFGDIDIDVSWSSIDVSGSYDVNTDTTTTTSTSEKGSTLDIGNKLTINANKDVNVVASGIVAESDIDINAETGSVNVLSAEQLEEIKIKNETDTITVGASVGNAWVGAAEKMVKTVENTDNNHQGWTSGALNAASAAVEVVATLPTFGFYAGANISATHAEDNSTTENVTNAGSAIISKSGDVSLKADKDVNIHGSTVASTGDDKTIDLIAGGDVNITASKDTSNTSSHGHTDTVGTSISSKNILDELPTYDRLETEGNSSSTTYNNSVVSNENGTINIKSGKDTNVIGANVEGKGINLEVDADLNVKSLQNESSYNNDTSGFNVNPNAIAAGITDGSGSGSRKWTDNQTTIIGSESVKIKVRGNTDNTGAVIANATRDEDGNLVDDGNLDLTTGTLTYGNLTDNDDTDHRMTHVEVGGITKIQHTTGSTDKGGITYATIGIGNITVGGDNEPALAGLNRDITETQVITKDESEKGYAIDMELDAQTIYNVGWDIPGELWNLPNTVVGGIWGGAGMLYSNVVSLWSDEKPTTHEWDAENRVHIFKNNPLGVYGTGATTGNVINFMNGAANPNSTIWSYQYGEVLDRRDGSHLSLNQEEHKVNFLKHELKHRDQGSYLGIFFLPVYGLSGGASASNWMEKQADRAGNDAYKSNLQLNGEKR